MTENFIIPLDGLKNGEKRFSWDIETAFFEDFGNTDIRNAGIKAEMLLSKSGDYVGVDVELDGNVTVPCDRCLEDLDLDLHKVVKLSVKFGDEPSSADADLSGEERETVYLPSDGAELDMRQIIYDYVCLSLPMSRVHPEGECDEQMLAYISEGESVAFADREVGESEEEIADSPFAALKGLFKDN